jgi:hypothetical protein
MAIFEPTAASLAAASAVNGGATTMSQCVAFATSGFNAKKNARVSACVLNIFQLPAITGRLAMSISSLDRVQPLAAGV